MPRAEAAGQLAPPMTASVFGDGVADQGGRGPPLRPRDGLEPAVLRAVEIDGRLGRYMVTIYGELTPVKRLRPKRVDELGGPTTFNHYAWGWTFAGNTPFRRWKRETYRGGISDPFIVHWPTGIKAKGEVRTQYAHAIDMVPTTEVHVHVANKGGPADYVEKNWERLVGAAQELAEIAQEQQATTKK